ncbi:cupin domain-containing protein [Halobellus limi]|uniref:Cupin domain protein n=1 Tax=Halobellus limi TaxID=699433 RepID=A0A1H5TBM3_9EURY|nr:hypothetical protein [Halobellus limi]QCC47351.1 hypothetical protein DV707_06575 [Halobellus limi]SEF60225.1 Cupin domain protein [Halobellus limi]
MTEGYNVVEPESVPKEQFNTCETSVRKLTERLGATELRVNQVLVEPGEVTTPHTHEGADGERGQEEVFVALTDGQIAIEGSVHDVPEGGVVRVRPDVERNLLNRTGDRTHVWLAFGAPPVGTVDDFGSYVVSDGE